MIEKKELVTQLLLEHLNNVKTGIIVKGIEGVVPGSIAKVISETINPLYVAIVGYGDVSITENDKLFLTDQIEKAVLWRSQPECAGHILVFINSDKEKLHSLAEFDVVTTRDISRFLLESQLKADNNTPTQNFWAALRDTSDYYTLDALIEYVNTVQTSNNPSEAIQENMWMLNLLSDKKILGTKANPKERLANNRNLIFAIGQLSEDSRKKLSRSLVRTNEREKVRLQSAYYSLQNLYKYGKRETLKDLDYETVQDLFSASQNRTQQNNQDGHITSNDNSSNNDSLDYSPIKPKELDTLVSNAVVFGDEEDSESLQNLLQELTKHFDPEIEENDEEIHPGGGLFGDRTIIVDTHQGDLRKLVGKFCNLDSWGGIMMTDESVLKDAVSADITGSKLFNPEDSSSIISFSGGIDGSQALFNFIIQFDSQFDLNGIETAERFAPIIENLKKQRSKLLSSLDLIMYHPVLLFGASEEKRQVLIDYIQAWERLYHAFSINEPIMRQISAGGTGFIARALLLLDVLYVRTPKEWKGLLLPLHPIFLWRYYEVFRTLPSKKSTLSEEEKDTLSKVLLQLPQVLSFIIANGIVTDSSEDRVLPCSGNIEMLPTFENKTNRYLGDDGTESIDEILTRWVGFAPYTRNEIRICSVDAPDLIGILRQIKSFMDNSACKRIVYDVYLTRNQNGNTELSKLDYAGKDYEIGEYIKEDKISISIKNVCSAYEVKTALDSRPVHVAFYFDQSSYAIEFGPSSQNLYISPLVITYDYDFDEIQHKGSIFPSSEMMESGLIGDYHKLMKSADVISNNMNPRTTYNGSADMTAVVSTIEDNQTQWLVVADRDTNNYQPQSAIPIGEKLYDKRMVNVWASDKSRIISQYLSLLRGYNLYPKAETMVDMLRRFGHIASNGLISIPRFGADMQAIGNKKKGLLGTLFAASWYIKKHKDALVASLDDDKARLWLQNRKYGNERADLVGLYFDGETNTLHIQPIEVKTRDESPDAYIARDDVDSKVFNITGHAADQIAYVIEILKQIFFAEESITDMFTSARKEVLKYQIVSECFRNVHDVIWQKRWYDILKKAFATETNKDININLSGILIHIKLNESSGGEHISCRNPEFDDCHIDYWKLTAKEVQSDVLGDGTLREMWTPDYDETDEDNEASSSLSRFGSDTIDDFTYEPIDTSNQDDTQKSIEIEVESLVGTEPNNNNFFNANQSHPISDSDNIDEKAISKKEIEQLVKDFKRACGDYHVALRECEPENSVIGPSVIRLKFRLGRGQALQGLESHLEDIGREMKRTGVIIQDVPNSDELLLDVPRLKRDQVLFKDVVPLIPNVTSPEQLYFPIGRTPNGKDLIENLGQMPHMLVGGSTGSGKSVFLFTMLATMLMTHPHKEDLQLILSSSKLEDFIHFEGLPHLYSGSIISDATEATRVIKEVVFEESERRGRLLAEARVANIIEYNKVSPKKLAPIVVVIDEFADLADQLETKREQSAFYKPVQRIAQAGRSRGIHLVICTQRPEAKLVPSTTKAQLNGRVALRVNDGISSRMIIESPEAQYLQKHGDMIYKNGDITERAQGYYIGLSELDDIVQKIIREC